MREVKETVCRFVVRNLRLDMSYFYNSIVNTVLNSAYQHLAALTFWIRKLFSIFFFSTPSYNNVSNRTISSNANQINPILLRLSPKNLYLRWIFLLICFFHCSIQFISLLHLPEFSPLSSYHTSRVLVLMTSHSEPEHRIHPDFSLPLNFLAPD